MKPLKKQEKILLGAVGILVVAVLLMQLGGGGQKTVAPAGASASHMPASTPSLGVMLPGDPGQAASLVLADPDRLAAQREAWELLGDPFAKVQRRRAMLADVPDLQLGGIAWSTADPMAIINDEVLKQGDMLLGYTISEIHPDRVILVNDKGEVTLRLE